MQIQRILNVATTIRTTLRWKSFDKSEADGRAKERHRRILLGYIASFSTKILGIGALLISTPITLRYLGDERFGIWMVVSSAIVILGLADFGIGNGLLNVIAEANGRDDRELAKRATTNAMVWLIAIGTLLGLVFSIAYPYIDWRHLLNVSRPELADEAGRTVAVLVVCLAINLPLMTVQRVQSGYQEVFESSLWQAAGSLVMVASILLAVYLHAGLPWLVLATVGGPTAVMAANWVHQFLFVRRWLLPNLQQLDWKMARRLATLGALWAWFQLMSFIGLGADNWIISHYFGAKAVGSYAVMSRMLSGLLIAQSISTSLWPAFAEAIERGDHKWVRQTFRRTMVLFSAIGLAGAIVMGVASFWIIRIWIGRELEPPQLMALGFASWCFIINIFAAVAALMANNRLIKQFTGLITIGALTSLILKLTLTPALGVTWVIWATVVGYGLVCVPTIKSAYHALDAMEQREGFSLDNNGAPSAVEP